MYSLTRLVTAVQEERITSGVRNVVSSTMSRLMPSMPRWKPMPAEGIQGSVLRTGSPGLALSKLKKSGKESRNTSRVSARVK